MESNQITCPQCGLKNNYLANACVQCGIIFVKNASMLAAQATHDDQKRRAIEEAEALLDQTQPPNGIEAMGTEMARQSDPYEDTIEMKIPSEEVLGNEPEASAQEESKPDENHDLQTTEIEMEDIETPMEAFTDTVDAEALFLTEVNGDTPAEPMAAETDSQTDDPLPEPQTAEDQKSETVTSDTANETDTGEKQKDPDVKPPENGPTAETEQLGVKNIKAPEAAKSETAAHAEGKTPAPDFFDPTATGDHSVSKGTDRPAEQEVKIDENVEPAMTEKTSAQIETSIHAAATIEMPEIPTDEDALIKQQEDQVREALKKQREAQAKAEAEAREKEKAVEAKAAALKKKKLAKVRAEALMKQKAAQARALKKKALVKAIALKKQKASQAQLEALKKQKEAQTAAEASAQDIQVASTRMTQADAASMNPHERLLGLLKRYKGKAIGINYDNSSEIKEAELIEANEEFFSVMVKEKKLQYSYPLKTILTIVEGQDGVETGKDDPKTKFDAVIKVYPMVFV
jgi:hypothetical protein